MQTLARLRTAAILKSLKADGLMNRDIIQLVKTEGWPAVRRLAQQGPRWEEDTVRKVLKI